MLIAPLLIGCFSAPKADADDTASRLDTAEGDTPVFVDIPASSFPMGCEVCDVDEAPVHTVALSAYTIGTYEVTVEQYGACVARGACEAVPEVGTTDGLPMTLLTWEQAEQFCSAEGRRLPTEAEWEYAARGDDGRRYPWGDAAPDCTLAASRPCTGGLEAVGQHPDGVGPFGLHDMAGNAWEWVADYYAADYYAVSPTEDPEGPSTYGLRVVRGIDLYSNADALRASNRTFAIPDGRSAMVGFRCVGDL